MKKLLSIVLCLVFVLSLAACKEEEKPYVHPLPIEDFAAQGMLSDIGYKLGDDVDSTKTAMQSLADDTNELKFEERTDGEYTVMSIADIHCCYKTDDKEAGLTHISKGEETYGFESGAIVTDVRDKMSEMGYDAEEREPKEDELFFLMNDTYSVLEYEIKGNTVLFVFQSNYGLCAVAIRD